MIPEQAYPFAAPVLQFEDQPRHHYVPVPAEIADALQAAGVRRLIAELNGQPVRRALQGRRDGERHLVLGQGLLRTLGLAYGDVVAVVLRPDPDPEHVELGEEFEAVLAQDEEAAARFYGFPTGYRRSLAYYVTSAKRPETRLKRALELAHKLRTRTLHGDLHPDP